MKEKHLIFARKVALTTFLAFFLISFFVLGIYGVAGSDSQTISLLDSSRFMLGKLYLCVFPFSLCLGFLNRLTEREGKCAMMRVVHFLLAFAAYFVFMDLLYSYLFLEPGATLAMKDVLKLTLPYFVFYPITLWVTSLGRAIFLPKEKKTFKSILD